MRLKVALVLCLLLTSSFLPSETKPLVLDGIEGFWVPRADFEQMTLALVEADQWREAFTKIQQENQRLTMQRNCALVGCGVLGGVTIVTLVTVMAIIFSNAVR